MSAKRAGLLARCLDGRIDRSVLSDVGVLVGLGVFGVGLFRLWPPAAWLFTGAVIVAVSVLAVLPAKKGATKAPKGEP